MEFYDVVGHVLELLQRQKRVSYRALKRQFSLDDDYIEDLKEELLFSHPVVDEDGRGLVWTGETREAPEPTSQPDQPEPQPVIEQVQPVQATQPIESHTPEAERRQLTVMFVDLVGSTELSGQLDPEDYREVVRQYQQVCSEVIQRYDGHIAQYLGDGLLVYFGYPVAHEEDAQRAVRSGLDIVEAIRSLNIGMEQEKGIRLAVRLGIHTGLVVVGEMGGEGRQEQLALGETPNIAARIQGLAEPNTVMVSDATYRLVQGFFDFGSLGEHDLRGVSQPIAIYRVLRESGAQSRLEVASTRGLTPLVGRESESTLLFERWGQAKDGNGQVILLSGEAGIGKSRLVQVLKDHVANELHTRIECRSSPYFTNSALYPITDFLQRVLRFQPDDTPEQKLEKLTQNLRHYRLPLEETVPLFGALLSLPVPDEGRYPPLNLSPQRQRQKTLESIVAILLELAERQPILFILEDLHWTDPSTLELLDLLVDQTPTASLCVLLTCRPEFQPTWQHRSYLIEVTLNRLSHTQVESMAQQVTGGKELPAEVLKQIIEKTDGVPLFVEEMTKAVLESGVVKEIEERYELTGPLSSLSIPSTLQDSLMARLDRLVTAKGIAQYGAVIGRQFSYALLQAVSQLDNTVLDRELGRLVDAELVYQRGLPPQATYLFKHALIQDTAYESLLRSTRQGYHRRIAEVVKERFPDIVAAQPELLAQHFTEAGLNKQAVGYWHQAGEKAIQRSAHVEGVAHFTQGLALLKSVPNTAERARQELSLQNSLGLALMTVRGYAAAEVEQVYLRARALSQEVDDSVERVRALMGLYAVFFVRAKHDAADELTGELLNLAEALQDPLILIQTYATSGESFLWQGKFVLARTRLEQGMSVSRPPRFEPLTYFFGHDPAVQNLSALAGVLWVLGYPECAAERCDQAVELAQGLSHPFSVAFALTFKVLLHQLRKEPYIVKEYAETLTALATENGFSFRAAIGSMLLGWAEVHGGTGSRGIARIKDGIAAFQRTGAKLNLPGRLGLLAEAYGQVGQHEQGLLTLEEAQAAVNSNGEHYWEAELHRLQGELLLQQSPDNATEAEACFHQAISIAQNQSAKSWELRASTSLARLWQSQGKVSEAHGLLAPVYGWFTEGFDTLDLIEAKALLDELS